MAGFIFVLFLAAAAAHIIPTDTKSVIASTWSLSNPVQDHEADFHVVDFSASLDARSADVSDSGAVPWQVLILSPVPPYFCTGSLIALDRVLTSGRCTCGWHSPSFVLYFGTEYMSGANDTTSPEVQTRSVRETFIHPDYRPWFLKHDLAILILDTPVERTATVYPVSLPGPQDGSYVGVEATVAGWCTTQSGMNETVTSSEVLQSVTVDVISNEDCADSWLGSLVLDSHICTSGMGGGGICVGDAGGALTYIDPVAGPVQIGVVSFVSPEGCEADMPSGYTRVTEYLDWIKTDPDSFPDNVFCSDAARKTSGLAIILAVIMLLLKDI